MLIMPAYYALMVFGLVMLSACAKRNMIYDAIYTEDEYMRGENFKVGKGGRI